MNTAPFLPFRSIFSTVPVRVISTAGAAATSFSAFAVGFSLAFSPATAAATAIATTPTPTIHSFFIASPW